MLTWEILKSFEFDKIIDRLSVFLSCKATKEEFQVQPSFSSSEIVLCLQRAAEFQEMVRFDGDLDLRGLSDLRPILQLLGISGSALNVEGLLKLWRFFLLCEETESFVQERKIPEKYPALWNEYFSKIRNFVSLRKKIEKVISPDGTILDTASDHLYQLRRNIRVTSESIEKVLNQLLQNPKMGSLFQEKIYTIRKERYVVPIRIQYRHVVDGVIVDYSSSGSTVFIEPKIISRLNNELELLKIKEKEEVESILYQLTSLLRPSLNDISRSFWTFIQLDFLRAKVKLGETWEGIIPQVGGEELIIREGKHPLLFKKAVPFDLFLSPSEKILVVSGPNAGGKTVLLKSIALIVSLAFCGIPVPAKPGSRIPFYEDIFVDIGDHQDIENELSTFTSRTRNLAETIQRNCSQTLFLIDELGAGTDPNEGTALAMAVLKYLREKGATCVVTTHLPVVKYRASQEEGMGMASLTINPDTFEPAYRLVLGEIGASYGIRIAERVGLPKEIIKESLHLLSEEEIQLNELLIALAREKNRLVQIVAENSRRAKDLEEKEREIAKRIEDLKKREKILLREFKQELEQYLSQTKDEVSRMVGKLRKENQLNQEKYELWKKRIKYEEEKLQKIEEAITEPYEVAEEDFQEGDTVLIDFLNERGTIVTLEKKKKNALVDIGGRKVRVSVTALRKLKDQKPLSLPSHFSRFTTPLLENKIEIRSLTKDEAFEKLDQYLDRVVLAGFTTVYIIHGKGEGILREMTHEFLRKHPQVESFRLGYPEEGGMGVTVVTLKS